MDTDGSAVASAMRRHADTLDGLRYRTEAIRFASTLMPRDAAAYGTMCGWIADCLEGRTQRQDGLVEYVSENLRIAARNLRTAAAAHEGRAAGPAGEPDALGAVNDAVFRASYWYPGRSREPIAEPAPRLAEQIQPLVDEISGKSWADEQFTGGNGAEVVPIALDGAIAHFDAMRELLSQLVGRPEIVAAQARAWNDMSAELHRIAGELEFHLDSDLREWKGEDHAAYQALMEHNVEAIGGVGATAAALGAAVEGAGVVVSAALDLVRGRSVELAAHVVRWASAANPAAEPSVTPLQLAAAVAKWALMVMRYVTALARSLHNLRMLLEG